MLNKMSEAQRSMLVAAAAAEDRSLQAPANARGAALKTFAGKLIEAGWVREVKARDGAPVWRKDADSGETYALKLTAKGLKAVAAASRAADGDVESVPITAKQHATKPNGRQLGPPPYSTVGIVAQSTRGEKSPTSTRAPRAASKLGRVVGMLIADTGATIGELTTATGWLEHTTRAALTGLRHRGYSLSLTKQGRDGASVYRIASGGGESAK
jgi:Protein of unknown function (DUF3489)